MTITRIGSATGVNSLTMPAHAAGDLLLMFAYRDGSTTAPALPAGWTDLNNGGTATNACRIAYKIAASGSEVSGTWTNATSLICLVYRSDGIIGVGGVARSSAASKTVSYPALTMVNGDGTSWVAGFGAHRSVNTSVETAPTGMTNITSVLDATDEAAAHDTNGTVSSWSLQTVSVGGTSSGWIGATVEITDEALPVPPSGDNPCTIMASASEVDLFFDAAASDLFEDTAGTTAATTDGDPVNFIASLWGSDFVAGASSGRNAVLRLPSGDDPYLEAVPGSSQLRASLARSGDLYVICRGRWNGTANDQEAFWTLTNNASQFYTGNFMVPRYFPFGFNYIQTETSVGYAVTTAAVAITRGAWSTLEIWVDGSTIYTAVDGGTPETYAASGPLGDTTLMDIFGSIDGGVSGSLAVDIRRLAVLNVIPDSTERTNLLDWAANGDSGSGGTEVSGTGAAVGTSSVAGIGKAQARGIGASVGSSTAAAFGKAHARAVGAAVGTGVVAGAGRAEARAVGTSDGVGVAAGIGRAGVRSTGAAVGVSVAAGVGRAAVRATGAAVGTSTAAAISLALKRSVGLSGGAGVVAGIGRALARAVGAVSGAATAAGAGKAQARGAGSSTGISFAAAVGKAQARATGTAVGSSTVAGISGGSGRATGSAVGTSTASGVGRATARALGASAGVAVVAGIARAIGRAIGAAAGAAGLSGIARARARGLGAAGGAAEVSGIGRSVARAVGAAEGTSTAVGIGVAFLAPDYSGGIPVDGVFVGVDVLVEAEFGFGVEGRWQDVHHETVWRAS